jgi:hypothetical protein
VLGVLGAASAQRTLEMFSCGDFAPRFAVGDEKAKPAAGPVVRLARILGLLLLDEGPRGNAARASVGGQTDRLLVRGTADEVSLVRSVLEQLRQEHPPRARLQCSLLTMPAALVKTHELKDAFAPCDETAFGKLVRDAVKQKGTLQNLPELIVTPLAPFVAEPPAKPGAPVPADDPTLRLHGEMVPVKAGEVAFAVQLVRGALPEDRTQLAKQMVLHRAFRLEAGKAVIAVAVAGDQATVVMVRCVEIASDLAKKEVGK